MIQFFYFESGNAAAPIYEEYLQRYFKPEYCRIYDDTMQRLDGFSYSYGAAKGYTFQSIYNKKRKQIRTIAKHHMFRRKNDII